jgi:hypothetical protein
MSVQQEIAALARMGIAELHRRHVELFGEPTRTGNRAWLQKRLAWRIQSQAEGGLSERALCRAAELANDANL